MRKGRPLEKTALVLLVLLLLRVALGWAGARAPLQLFPGDVGQWLDSGDRFLRGELPFRDYFGFYGPLLYLGSAVLYRAFGANWFSILFQFEVVSPAISLLLAYAVATRLLRRDWARGVFLSAVFLLGLDHWPGCFCFRVWGPLACLAFADEALRNRKPRRLAGACLAAGTWLFVSIETAAAGLLSIAVLAALERDAWTKDRRSIAAFSGVLAAPAAALLLAPSPALEYARTMIGLARTQNWFGGLPYPAAPPFSIEAWLLYSPPALILGAGAWLLCALAGARSAEARREAAGGLAVAAFGAVLFRAALGRSDDMHLVFTLAPVVLLWLRLWDRMERAPWAPVAAAAGLLPFLTASARGGELDFLRRVAAHSSSELVPWPGEGVLVRERTVDRMEALSRAIQERVAPGKAVLALPLGVAAHSARRPAASPFLFLDYLPAVEDGSRRLLDALERRGLDCVLIDPKLAMPRNGAGLSGLPLTWFSEADEPVTRGLRVYLESRFEPDAVVEGAVFLKRRKMPLEAAPEEVVGTIEAPAPLEPGKAYRIGLPRVPFDELRLTLRCRYPPGLASLAKTRLEVTILEAGGARRSYSLPVPPPGWDPEFRVPEGGAAAAYVEVEVESPGAFNPRPTAVELGPLRLVAREARKRS